MRIETLLHREALEKFRNPLQKPVPDSPRSVEQLDSKNLPRTFPEG